VLRLLAGSEASLGGGAPDDDQATPVGPVEMEIASLWAQVLAVTSVARQQNFFDLGGDSLLATDLLERLRRRFGVELTLRTLFAEPTVARLAQRVCDLTAGPAGQPMDEGVL
jgi:aryl carrier-like protein